MIDPAKTIASLLDVIDSINKGETTEKDFEVYLRNGRRVNFSISVMAIKNSTLRLVSGGETGENDGDD